MALFKTEKQHVRWGIRNFPKDLKDDFKQKCKEDKVEMVSVMRSLTRGYVNETTEMYKNKETKQISITQVVDPHFWAIKSFPTKLKADFKSCCAARGDKMVDAVIYLVEGYINGE